MGSLVCRDDPVFDEGIRMMVEEIVNLSIVDYMNAIIFLDNTQNEDPLYIPAFKRRMLKKDCENFFLHEYEMMTGSDGERKMREYEQEAHRRKHYINRKWARRSNERRDF